MRSGSQSLTVEAFMKQTTVSLRYSDTKRFLYQNIHPSGWKNPEPAPRYNLVVIGAGTAGLVTAAGAAGLGAKVALIERRFIGGDCLNSGCVPSKAFLKSAYAAYEVRTSGKLGIFGTKNSAVHFGRIMNRVDSIKAKISIHDSAERFSKNLGVDVFFGEAKFTAADSILVDGKLLRFKKAAICTGARAAVPSIPGIETSGYHTNETVFQLKEKPRRLVMIGGGPLGCELAQGFARMGTQVTIVQHGEHLLPREDIDASRFIHRSLTRDGIKIHLQAQIERITTKGKIKTLAILKSGKRSELFADELLVGVGRIPNVEGLNLEAANIVYDLQAGVQVSDYLQTSNQNVYAAGDVCSDYKFTHAAEEMARIVISNSLFMTRRKRNPLIIPRCTYTDPEIAHIGMSAEEARGKGFDVSTLTVPFADVDRTIIEGDTEGFVRVHLKSRSDTLLGGTIVARHAGEMINELSFAMANRLGLAAIGKTIHPYPTRSEALKKVADAYYKTRLTPGIKKLFAVWLKWQRA